MLWLFLACGNADEKETATTETAAGSDPTEEVIPAAWYGDIQPFIAENCTICHHEDGSAPFVFETFAQVDHLAPVMLNAMRMGSMPPWLPDTECHEYEGERVLTQAQIERFSEWVDNGKEMGDASLGESEAPFAADIEAMYSVSMPEGFTPITSVGVDQYRCFPLDLSFEEETFITQTQVKPGSAQVHHVLIYALDPEMANAVEVGNGADGTIGYPCFGDPFPPNSNSYDYGFPTQIGAWVPGLEPNIFPEGTALRIKPNSPIVMQVHYSALAGEPMEDSSSYHIVTTDTPPELIASTRPLAVRDLNIPAGSEAASFTESFTNYYERPFVIASLAAHMHLLGKSQDVVITRNDGTEECALSIPDWDFSWQQSYIPVGNISLEPGEKIDVTCTYDNSADNQPIVDGERIEPSTVTWGDGTLDEMCLLYATTLDPYRPSPPVNAEDCYGVEECITDCGESLSCVIGCEAVAFSCISCALDVFLDCGISDCLIQGVQAEPCLRECYAKSIMMGSTLGDCMDIECPDEYSALVECADPVLKGEECRPALQACGIPLSE